MLDVEQLVLLLACAMGESCSGCDRLFSAQQEASLPSSHWTRVCEKGKLGVMALEQSLLSKLILKALFVGWGKAKAAGEEEMAEFVS